MHKPIAIKLNLGVFHNINTVWRDFTYDLQIVERIKLLPERQYSRSQKRRDIENRTDIPVSKGYLELLQQKRYRGLTCNTQSLLGNELSKTAEIYTHVFNQQLRNISNPLAKLLNTS